jgi:hypothetical protein
MGQTFEQIQKDIEQGITQILQTSADLKLNDRDDWAKPENQGPDAKRLAEQYPDLDQQVKDVTAKIANNFSSTSNISGPSPQAEEVREQTSTLRRDIADLAGINPTVKALTVQEFGELAGKRGEKNLSPGNMHILQGVAENAVYYIPQTAAVTVTPEEQSHKVEILANQYLTILRAEWDAARSGDPSELVSVQKNEISLVAQLQSLNANGAVPDELRTLSRDKKEGYSAKDVQQLNELAGMLGKPQDVPAHALQSPGSGGAQPASPKQDLNPHH